MKHYSKSTNDATLRKCDEMGGDFVIVIHLEFLRNPLFNDKHLMAQGECLLHERVRSVNGSNLEHCFTPKFFDLCGAISAWLDC